MTSQDGSSRQAQPIQTSFSPRIAVFTSPELDQDICAKNGLESFVSLLRPFEHVDRVSVRHSNYSTTILDSIRLSFFEVDSSATTNESDWLKEKLDRTVFTEPNIKTWTKNSNGSKRTGASSSTIVPTQWIKKDHEWIGTQEEENGEDYPQAPTPWYIRFMKLLYEYRPIVEYDHTSHPIAAFLVVSTNNPDPLKAFAELHSKTEKDGNGWSDNIKDWLDTGTILRYYLLVHIVNDSELDAGFTRAKHLLQIIKHTYGLNSAFISINSEKSDWIRKKRILDRDPNFIFDDDHHSNSHKIKQDYWSKYFDHHHPQTQFGEFISEEDVLGLRVFLREFTLQSLIPHIERCIQQWNDSLAASRKGLTGRLFSVGKKYFTSKVPGTGNSNSTNSEQRYNPITNTYPHQSQEAQTRRLADFSFILADYKFASQMYEYLRKDSFNDQAWSYYTSATQMIGLCTLLQSSFNQRTKLSIDLQRFLFDDHHSSSSITQLRIVMIYFEMAKAVGNPHLMASSLIRIATNYNELISGLIYEQVSRIVTPRQTGLYLILASQRYKYSEQIWLSKICLRQSPLFIGWQPIEDYLDYQIALLNEEHEHDRSISLFRYWDIVRRRIVSGETDSDDELYVTKFRTLYQKAIDINPSLILPQTTKDEITIFDIKRCKIRVPYQNHLRAYVNEIDTTVWEQLNSRCTGSSELIETRQNEINTAVINEPFYLDLFLRNPLHTSIKLTNIEIKLSNLDTFDQADDDLLSNLEIAQVDDVELGSLETREISVKLISKKSTIKFEVTEVKFKFDSLIECCQGLKKKGKRLQSTLKERLGRIYTNDQSMQVRVREEVPILEILSPENLPSTIYDGQSFISRISIRNSGQVGLKGLKAVISHTSLFRFCSDSETTNETSLLYETSDESSSSSSNQIIIETPDHILPESPVLLAEDLKNDEHVEVSIVCRGEEVGRHATCWFFVFQHATSGEILKFRHVHHLTVLPSLTIKPLIRPSLTPDSFYLLTLQISGLDIPEDIEIYQISTISTHWHGKLINPINPQSSSLIQLKRGSSSSVNLAFELNPLQNSSSEDPPSTFPMLEQLRKLLMKENLDPGQISTESVRSHVSLTHPNSQSSIRIDSPTLLNSILSSHQNLRRKELESYFTSLTSSEITHIFPLTSSRSVDLMIFWRTVTTPSASALDPKKVEKMGHHYIPDLKLGATTDLVGPTLELVKDKAGGMYHESQLLQKALVKQFQLSEYGLSSDPISIDVKISQPYVEWDFMANGPLTIPVTFTLKNLSTSRAAEYKLSLLRRDFIDDDHDHSSSHPQQEQNRRSSSLSSIASTSTTSPSPTTRRREGPENLPAPNNNSNLRSNSLNSWIGKLVYSGRLRCLETVQIKSTCWIFGPGFNEIKDWKCQSNYELVDPNHNALNQILGEENSRKSHIWSTNGALDYSPIPFISVANLSPVLLPSPSAPSSLLPIHNEP
ncbi:hypothetical protein MJO28_003637 [Puccinia striiformis f. sp. tritici]|uniref:Uncharacterized protein n=1 Tax=Puccinia striiformis f. sp. tritici TaxID=168172 RepID=A0ACC0ENS8_9BASI|nr:hypothetical protein MJO28_003637 [Puccinia striiformis f. sp. tritici]